MCMCVGERNREKSKMCDDFCTVESVGYIKN